jgi:hypothetical protein
MRFVRSIALMIISFMSASMLRADPMATVVRGAPQMSFEQCKARVRAAFIAEGVDDLRDFGNGWLGRTSSYSVSAGCIQGNRETVVVITTAGQQPTPPRDRMLALIFSEGRCVDVTGAWNWFNGLTVTIGTDGRFQSTAGVNGTWSATGGAMRQYRLRWDNGFVDTVSLSEDGARLSGTNESGTRVSATRDCAAATAPSGSGGGNAGAGTPGSSAGGGNNGTRPVSCATLTGTWTWFTGAQLTFRDDGTFLSTVNGRWERGTGDDYVLRWENGYVDVVRLSSDGRRLSGQNKQGTAISGERTTECSGSSTSNPPATTLEACADPRTLARMDEWLARADPPENLQRGWSVRYEPWGRIVGRSPSNSIAVSGPPDTSLTRCQWLLARAASLNSTNLGTLAAYLAR